MPMLVIRQAQLDALLNPSASDLAQAQASVTQAQASLTNLKQGGTAAAITQAQAAPSAIEHGARPAAQIPAGYPAGLTAREIAVLRLVAQGLTDVQVAEKLVLSPRTVSTHLTSIYSKLQVGSRSAATRFAVEQGLV